MILLVAAGCGSSQEADSIWVPRPIDTTAHSPNDSFVTQTDTITAEGSKHTESTLSYNAAPVRFTVQIGSYREAQNAGAAQVLARERFRLPVVNDYSAQQHLYRIRVGFFETEEGAEEFRKKVRAIYPGEYKDAWIVQISK